jgi:hypothetical protein
VERSGVPRWLAGRRALPADAAERAGLEPRLDGALAAGGCRCIAASIWRTRAIASAPVLLVIAVVSRAVLRGGHAT